MKDFTDGCTNRLVGCYVEDQPWDMVLVRVYGEGTDLFIDREQEIRNIQLMYEAQLGCPIYCSFLNGICYGFAPGHTLDKDSVRDPKIASFTEEQSNSLSQLTELLCGEISQDFTDGCTNRLVGCYVEDQPWDMVLVRVYGEGTDLFIDREQEIRNIQLMYEAQLGCPIYCSFLNGICYGFAPGHTLDKDSVRDPKIAS
ncbi:ETNK2 [Cordylochernes scorpioides]|uniref:ethanolamine kinase n=1 Tax=Cordylochernes scorpioides TaxID=51811 RepID=A0ABY6L553_9ARAC|nr:ETNK2 [Cordylochernes scorpioides]